MGGAAATTMATGMAMLRQRGTAAAMGTATAVVGGTATVTPRKWGTARTMRRRSPPARCLSSSNTEADDPTRGSPPPSSSFLMDEFEAKIKISKEVHQHANGCKSGAFEVYVNGDLIHSKMTIKGHGK